MANIQRARRHREAVLLWMQGHGFPEAHAPRNRQSPNDPPQSDVQGLPSWFLDVAADRHSRLSVRLDAARQDAAAAGREYAAVIQQRPDYGDRERGVEESFVLLDLETFATLLHKAGVAS